MPNTANYLIDTHCHLHDREFFTTEQAEEMIERAHKKGVKKIVCIGTSPEDSLVARDFAATHKNIYWTYGIHPENAGKTPAVELVALESFRRDNEQRSLSSLPIAIGEVGLDYHYEGYDRKAQIGLFEQMLQLAIDYELPLSFHVREAFDDFFAVTANFPKARGVVHSFTDNKKVLKRILSETNCYIGVNGLATYSTLPLPPLERTLLETDAPFLTPVPFRGAINEPAYIYDIAVWLSHRLGIDLEAVEQKTTQNAEKLFQF